MAFGNFYQAFQIVLMCLSPCIWGAALTVLYPFRRLTSCSWMVFAGAGIHFLSSSTSVCLSFAQMTGDLNLGENMNILYLWQGLSIVSQLATGLFAVGVWLSFRELRDRVDMLSEIVERGGNEVPDGDFQRGF